MILPIHKNRKLVHKWIFFIVLSLQGGHTLAQTNQVLFTADTISYDFKQAIIHYQGNVRARQDDTYLKADEVYIYYNAAHKIEKVKAIGQLAVYETLLNNKKDKLTANALNIFYYPASKNVILKGAAKITYNGNIFLGSTIFYNMNDKTIKSPTQKNNQTKIVLQPFQKLLNRH